MDGALGLPVLVSRVLAGLAAEVDDGGGGSCSLPVWSNVVRVVGDGTSERDLAVDARISRRLAVSAVTGAARRGWVTAAKAAGGRQVGLTPAGRAPKPDEGLPGHGQDWRPVRRAGGGTDTVSWVPLTALLSQCLVAFAIDYEGRPAWPLASTTLVVRHLGVAPMPLADAPADHGITGNGKSLLERHGIAVVEADPSSPRRKLVRLTPLGEKVRSHHDRFVGEVEAGWRDRFEAEVVDGFRRALEATPGASDPTWPDHVVAPLHLG